MKWGVKKFVYGVLVCIAVAALGQQARAVGTNPFSVTCDGVEADDQAEFITQLGQGYSALANGNVIKVTGICAGDYKFTQNITITNDAASTSLISTDGFDGMLELLGHTTVNGIVLKGTSLNPANSSNAVDFTSPVSPYSTFTEAGALVVHDGGVVTLQNGEITQSTVSGAFVTRESALSVTNTTITGNATGANNGNFSYGTPFSAGIFASDSSAVRLAVPSGAANTAVTITNNGPTGNDGCPGFGIILANSSSLTSYRATIGSLTPGAQNPCGQIFAESGSAIRLEATTVEQPDSTTGASAISVTSGSSMFLLPNANVAGAAADDMIQAGTTSANTVSTILLAGTSSLFSNTATIQGSATGAQQPTVQVSTGSTYTLAGGNTLSNTAGGTVLYIDHTSSLIHTPGGNYGLSKAQENITGKGNVQMQSSIDLGVGPVNGGAAFGLVWTGNIIVLQNSSFRMQGSAHVTGSVQVSQQSNAFFNCNNSLSNGGSTAPNCGGGSASSPLANAVDGGVSCPELVLPASNVNPSSHASNPTLVSPTIPTANLFGASSSFASGSPAAGTCLNF